MNLFRSIACSLISIIAAPALAQNSPPSGALADMVKCRAQSDDRARLQCYDAAAGALAQATAAGAIVVVDREDIRRTRRSLFGFNLPKLPFFKGDDSDEEVSEINFAIKSMRVTRDQKWLFDLDAGGFWQTTEVDTRQSTPKAGQSVKIRKAALGGYMLSVEGRRSLRAMRVR